MAYQNITVSFSPEDIQEIKAAFALAASIEPDLQIIIRMVKHARNIIEIVGCKLKYLPSYSSGQNTKLNGASHG